MPPNDDDDDDDIDADIDPETAMDMGGRDMGGGGIGIVGVMGCTGIGTAGAAGTANGVMLPLSRGSRGCRNDGDGEAAGGRDSCGGGGGGGVMAAEAGVAVAAGPRLLERLGSDGSAAAGQDGVGGLVGSAPASEPSPTLTLARASSGDRELREGPARPPPLTPLDSECERDLAAAGLCGGLYP